ncbi:glycosyltransferase [bacterium]|nr:glycosyltransferase [bacterium]
MNLDKPVAEGERQDQSESIQTVYNDGKVEKQILDCLFRGDAPATIEDNTGVVFHNFTNARENLLNWYPFNKNAEILEVGAGMGGLTGLLCDRVAHVTALENAPQRADIIRMRYAEKKNLTVITGNLADIDKNSKFDYILVVGVLEYVDIGKSSGRQAHLDFLSQVKLMLKPGGILLLAIENRFGLKYWCGAAEDHIGKPFVGIEGYKDSYTTRYQSRGVTTFDKQSLADLCKEVGLVYQRWYYPLADYKFPTAIFSDDKLPSLSDIARIKFTYPQESTLIADERELYREIISNDVFPFFANSFLLETSTTDLPSDNVMCAFLKRDYAAQYRLATIFMRDTVEKVALNGKAKNHLNELINNTNAIKKRGVPILEGKLLDERWILKKISMPLANKKMAEWLERGDLASIKDLCEKLETYLKKSSPFFSAKNVYNCELGDFVFDQEEVILEDGYIDLTFNNSFYQDSDLLFFDQEWRLKNVPLKFILYRALLYAFKDNSFLSFDKLLATVKINETMTQQFARAEKIMLSSIMDDEMVKRFDSDMYHEGLTLNYQRKQELSNKQAHIETLLESERSLNQIIDNQKKQLTDQSVTIDNQHGHIEQLLEKERAWEREKNSKAYQLAMKFSATSQFFLPEKSRRRFLFKAANKVINDPSLLPKALDPQRWRDYLSLMNNGEFAQAEKQLDQAAVNQRNANIALDVSKYDITLVTPELQPIGVYRHLTFPQVSQPLVSIIIPVYNQFNYTYYCLASILKHTQDIDYEVIIADDCSTDLTTEIAQLIDNIKIVRTPHNLRFLRNCNYAAKTARGKYILFLNNDTQVQEKWLSSLLDLIENDKTIGMVGSKLIYPDGRLQEAGGLVWNDASAWNYGQGQNPELPEFNYVKECDYISGAAIMIRHSLWDEIGGFDERFAPAYCEDSDLAFSVRQHGFKVVFQPLSIVVHFEGVSNGTDLSSGQKKYQVENTKKFYQKWQKILRADQFANAQNVFLACDRSRYRQHVLFVDHYVPMYDQDAGSKTTYAYIKMLAQKGFAVTFLGDNFYRHEPYTTALQQLGVRVLYGTQVANNLESWFVHNGKYFDIFYLNRPHISVKYLDLIRNYSSGKVIYYGHDLHFLRTRREYELSGDEKKLTEAMEWQEKELSIMRRTDMNYYPSSVEVQEIAKLDPQIPVKAISAYIFSAASKVDYQAAKTDGILFVGGFAHGPNLDAVKWFVTKIYPEIYHQTHAPFYIVGSKAPEEIKSIDVPGVICKGFVSEKELEELYQSCRLSVAPLRYGAGIKGKVIEAFYHGSPMVTTSVGIEGIDGASDFVCVRDQAIDFSEAVIKLYHNTEKLNRISNLSKQYVENHFSEKSAWEIINDDFGNANQKERSK